MKRRYKFLIFVVAWWLAAFTILPAIGFGLSLVTKSSAVGALEGLTLIAFLIGSLVWVVWPKNSN